MSRKLTPQPLKYDLTNTVPRVVQSPPPCANYTGSVRSKISHDWYASTCLPKSFYRNMQFTPGTHRCLCNDKWRDSIVRLSYKKARSTTLTAEQSLSIQSTKYILRQRAFDIPKVPHFEKNLLLHSCLLKGHLLLLTTTVQNGPNLIVESHKHTCLSRTWSLLGPSA